MKKLFAAVLALVLLLSSAALADEIRFLELPWLSGVEDVTKAVGEQLTDAVPGGYMDRIRINGNWIAGGGWVGDRVPVYVMKYSCDPCCEVAGLQVDRITLWFLPEGAGGKYSDRSTEGYQLVRAEYRFTEDSRNDYDGVFTLLEFKMRYLYGDPGEAMKGGGSGDNFSEDSTTYVWTGDNMTQAALEYTSKSYRGGTTSTTLYVTYGYGDQAFYEARAALEYDSGEPEDEPDAGPLNGL